MGLIKHLKSLFIREKKIENLEQNKKIKNNSDNENFKELVCYQRFGELKVYRRHIIQNKNKREEIFYKISKELDKIDI